MTSAEQSASAVVSLLAEYGLDAYRIAESGWNSTTYREVLFDPDGRALMDGDSVRTTERQWPEGFPIDRLKLYMSTRR